MLQLGVFLLWLCRGPWREHKHEGVPCHLICISFWHPGDLFHSVWGFERWVAPAVRKWIGSAWLFLLFQLLVVCCSGWSTPHPRWPVLSMCAHLDEGISDDGAKPTELWVKSNNTPWTGHKSMEWLTTTELQPWTPCLITLTTGWSSVCQRR